MSNIIVTLTGPSCSGKTTLTQQLVATTKFTEVISTTTRPKREGDVNGVSYHFVSSDEFEDIEMLESIEYNGNRYGGSIAEFEEKFDSGKIPVIVVEPHGMEQINKNAVTKGWTVINVFIDCPMKLQAERFLKRFAAEYVNLCEFQPNPTAVINPQYPPFNRFDPDDFNSLMTEYINRMVTIQTVESEWLESFNKLRKYSDFIIIEEFTKDNERSVINRIKYSVVSKILYIDVNYACNDIVY